MTHASARGIRWLLITGVFCLPAVPSAAEDRYLRLEDGLYELNADGTYHKVQGAGTNAPRPAAGSSRPTASSSPNRPSRSSNQFSGQERFMRFNDGLYERMADGTYTKVDERRQTQSSRYGASSTSMDPNWQREFGRPPQQWSNGGQSQQWNNRPQQRNGQSQQWSNRSQQRNDQNQQAARELGILLNVIGGVIQEGSRNNGSRPPRSNVQSSPSNFQSQPVPPQAPPRSAPRPSNTPPAAGVAIVPPASPPKAAAVTPRVQRGGNYSTIKSVEVGPPNHTRQPPPRRRDNGFF